MIREAAVLPRSGPQTAERQHRQQLIKDPIPFFQLSFEYGVPSFAGTLKLLRKIVSRIVRI